MPAAFIGSMQETIRRTSYVSGLCRGSLCASYQDLHYSYIGSRSHISSLQTQNQTSSGQILGINSATVETPTSYRAQQDLPQLFTPLTELIGKNTSTCVCVTLSAQSPVNARTHAKSCTQPPQITLANLGTNQFQLLLATIDRT